jgi:SAM-dependent methyltransferase
VAVPARLQPRARQRQISENHGIHARTGDKVMNEEQVALWNGRAGNAWVDEQELLDRMFAGFEPVLADAAAAAGHRVLDVGCGTGATTLAAARRLGPASRCLGVDISAPMIELARARAAAEGSPASFEVADAQGHPFTTGSVDAVISRFGVMFFEDPVAAFANLRRATADGGALRVITWRSAAENPFMTAAERAAAPLLPPFPARRPDGPGQFAMADEGRVRALLADSGWADAVLERLDVPCTMPATALETYASRLGPVGAVLQDVDDATRARAIAAVLAAFAPYIHGAEVRFTAACWSVGARARS